MIVFDSSTLILLAKAELLDAFIDDYKKAVIVPQEVNEECCHRKNSFDHGNVKVTLRKTRIKNLCQKLPSISGEESKKR